MGLGDGGLGGVGKIGEGKVEGVTGDEETKWVRSYQTSCGRDTLSGSFERNSGALEEVGVGVAEAVPEDAPIRAGPSGRREGGDRAGGGSKKEGDK